MSKQWQNSNIRSEWRSVRNEYCTRFGWTFSSFLTIRLLRNEIPFHSHLLFISTYLTPTKMPISTYKIKLRWYSKNEWKNHQNGKNDDNSHSKQCDGKKDEMRAFCITRERNKSWWYNFKFATKTHKKYTEKRIIDPKKKKWKRHLLSE